jgi:hypothetical protein
MICTPGKIEDRHGGERLDGRRRRRLRLARTLADERHAAVRARAGLLVHGLITAAVARRADILLGGLEEREREQEREELRHGSPLSI